MFRLKNYSISIDGCLSEKPMRDILGVNNIPRINYINFRENEINTFEKLNFSNIRFHDATLENPGFNIIDIHRIFPLFHLDENDSKNYFFDQTDDYLAYLEGKDVEIDFRLGETIDHSLKGRLVGVPDNIEKWARVCRNIIGHYKNGEMDGMKLNITRVTVWEEPDNSRLFGGTPEEYAEMFCAIYKLIKKDFPDVLVGGPTMMAGQNEYLKNFIEYCLKRGVTPDYISSTIYAVEPERIISVLNDYKDITDSFGLTDIKQSVAEWHMGPIGWNFAVEGPTRAFFKTENASFTCYGLMKYMDIDFVDKVYYYAWATSMWAVMDRYQPDGTALLPVYYGIMLYQMAAKECAKRLNVIAEDNDDIMCIAGVTEDNKLRVLVSVLRAEDYDIILNVKGAKDCSVLSVCEDYNEDDCKNPKSISGKDGLFELKHRGANGVYLLEFNM